MTSVLSRLMSASAAGKVSDEGINGMLQSPPLLARSVWRGLQGVCVLKSLQKAG